MPIDPDRAASPDPVASMHKVDARGLKCPLPVLRTRKALLAMGPGEQLQVLCTDPVSVIDIPHLVREMGFELLQSSQENGAYQFVIGKNREAT